MNNHEQIFFLLPGGRKNVMFQAHILLYLFGWKQDWVFHIWVCYQFVCQEEGWHNPLECLREYQPVTLNEIKLHTEILYFIWWTCCHICWDWIFKIQIINKQIYCMWLTKDINEALNVISTKSYEMLCQQMADLLKVQPNEDEFRELWLWFMMGFNLLKKVWF